MKLIRMGASRQWVCVGQVGRYFEFSLYFILYSLIFMRVYYFHNKKKTLIKTKKKRELFLTPKPALPAPAAASTAQPSPAHLALLRLQRLHKEPT